MDEAHRHVIREELLRSVAWAGLGLVGWPIIVTELAWLDPSVLTVFGLPVLTWAALTPLCIGVRVGSESRSSRLTATDRALVIVSGIGFGAVGALFLVVDRGYSAVLVGTAYVVLTGGSLLWYRYVRKSTGGSAQSGLHGQ